MNIDLEGEQLPYVVVPMCDVPAGKMPKTAVSVVNLALGAGMSVRSTYALALVPGVLRKIKGMGKGSGGPEDVPKMERVTETLETVVVRLGLDSLRAFASWHNGSFESSWVRAPGRWPVRLAHDGLRTWIKGPDRTI
jgi:hypothetical protein